MKIRGKSMEDKIKRSIAILLALCFLISLTATAVSAEKIAGADKIVTESTSATSPDGKPAHAVIFLPADTFKPKSIVHIVPIGWSYTFTYGHHPILKQSLLLEQPKYNAPETQLVPYATARSDGSVLAGYLVEFGSENQDNPFTVDIEYMALGVPK